MFRTTGQVPTRYSPVRHCAPTEAGTPFDLHVLGMPPAFVLSQDQTLRLKTDPARRLTPTRTTCSTGTATPDSPETQALNPVVHCVVSEMCRLAIPIVPEPDPTAPPPAHPFSHLIDLSKIQQPRRTGIASAGAEKPVEPGGDGEAPNDCRAAIDHLVPEGP